MAQRIERVAWFVDGFNLYYSLRSLKNGRYLWLDLGKLADSRIKAHQENVKMTYFTALTNSRDGSSQRQHDYLSAVDIMCDFPMEIVLNSFKRNSWECENCDSKNKIYREKQTDVALGVAMVSGAFKNEFDVAILVSADTDFIPAISQVKSIGKKVVVALPPGRRSMALEESASSVYHLKENSLRKAQLPNSLENSGQTISKPVFFERKESRKFRKWPLVHKASD